MEYDPLKVDSYATHLAAVNNTKDVIAQDDILNESGAILVRKGMPISSQIAEKILNFKLVRPLHDVVSIEDQLDRDSLHAQIKSIIAGNQDFVRINEANDCDELLLSACEYFSRYDLLSQKITVLSMQLPQLFEQTIVSAWLSLLIGKELELTERDLQFLFLASLGHDLGMLHIDPSVVNAEGTLTPEQWKMAQAHVVISYKIMDSIHEMPKTTTRAIMEHHECCDGTGYPKGKFERELALNGQIIALTDKVVSIYRKQLQPQQRSLKDVIPVLQINSDAHFYQTYDAIVRVIRRSELEHRAVIPAENISPFIENLISQFDILNQEYQIYSKMLQSIPLQEGTTAVSRMTGKIHRVFIGVRNAISGSGIINDGYKRWLVQVRDEKLEFAYREMEEANLMIGEVFYQVRRLHRLVSLYVKNERMCPEKQRTMLLVGLDKIKVLDKKKSG